MNSEIEWKGKKNIVCSVCVLRVRTYVFVVKAQPEGDDEAEGEKVHLSSGHHQVSHWLRWHQAEEGLCSVSLEPLTKSWDSVLVQGSHRCASDNFFRIRSFMSWGNVTFSLREVLELLPLAADGFPAFPHVVDISVTDKDADVAT